MTAQQTQTPNDNPPTFSQLLNNEIELLGALKRLMLNEKEAVETNNVDQLIPIADDKQKLLQQVEQASFNRQDYLNKRVIGQRGLQQLQSYIAQTDSSEGLYSQFKELQKALKECHDLNEVNAKVIAISQRNVERNLNILKGIDDKTMVYTAKGSTEANQSRLNGVKA